MKRQWYADQSCVLLAAIVCALSIAGWSLRAVWAQEAAAAADESTEDESLLEIPAGDATALAEHIQQLAQSQPEGETDEEQLAGARKILQTIAATAERLLQATPTDKQALRAHQDRVSALYGLLQLDAPKARERLDAAIAELRADSRTEVVWFGWQVYLSEKLSAWDAADDSLKAALTKELRDGVTDNPPTPLDVNIIRFVAQNLDHIDDPFVANLLAETVPVFQKSEDEEVRTALAEAELAGMLRRLSLPGKSIEIFGSLLDGGKVDWDSYRGKVVLVDFWATWCGPCREEVPNILAMYQAYHDKGFDVLGVSLDDTPDAAREYIRNMKLPWATLFSEKEEEWGPRTPLARYYGITGIPTAILVDQQGRVVHMNARGPYLPEQLQALLGDPVKPKDDGATKTKSDSPDEAAS